MRWLSLLILVLMFGFVATACGFPLNTSDGAVRIFGMIPTESGFALDVFSPFVLNGQGIASDLKLEVVDSDDRFIKSSNILPLAHPEYKDRALYTFTFDKPVTQLKRIRVESPNGNVYSISWTGVPEASTKNETIRLYGVTDLSNKLYDKLHKQYDFEIRITNNLSSGLIVSPQDFWLVDQFDYAYTVSAEEYKLLPGESVRYVLRSQEISALSRPKLLVFRPDNLAMELEGWY